MARLIPVLVLLGSGALACGPPGPVRQVLRPIALPLRAPVRALPLPPLERYRLGERGPTVLLLPDRLLPLSGVIAMVRTGSIDDPPDQAGLAELTMRALRLGAGTRSAEQISAVADGEGLRIGTSTGYELSRLSCSGRSRFTDRCLELVASMLTAPTFLDDELSRLRRKMVAETRQSRDDPGTLAELHLDNLLFGDDHPYGRAVTLASLERIDRAAVVSFRRQRIVGGAAVVAVFGDFDRQQVRRRLGELFGGWSGAPARRRPFGPLPAPPASRRRDQPAPALRVLLVDKPELTQSFIAIGHAGIRRADPRRDTARVLNHVLSGLRLTKVVRQQQGKTYSIRSRFDVASDDGSFIVKTFTRHAELWPTVQLVLGELRRVRRTPPNAAEIYAAKGRLAGGYAISFKTPARLALALMQGWLLGLRDRHVTEMGLRIERVGELELAAAARELIHPERARIVIVGRADAVAPQLKRAGVAFERIAFSAPISARERRSAGAPASRPTISPAEARAARATLERAARLAGARRGRIARLRVEGRIRIIPQVSFASPPLRGTYRLDASPPSKIEVAMSLWAEGTPLSMKSVQALDGDRGYLEAQGKRRVLSAERRTALRQAIWRQPALVLQNTLAPGVVARPVQPATIGAGQLAVEVRAPGQPPTALIFDRRSHRLVGLRYRDAKGRLRVTELSAHRRVGGRLIPHRVVTRRGRRVQTLELTRVRLK